MLASLLFRFINHFMRASPDYVLEVPENPGVTRSSSPPHFSRVAETVGTVVGAVAIGSWTEERGT